MKLPPVPSSTSVVDGQGRMFPAWLTFFQKLPAVIKALNAQEDALDEAVDDSETGLASKAAKSQPWSESVIIEFPDNGDYPFLKLGYACEWTEVETDCLGGSCTLTVKINATPLGGSANAVSTTRTTQSHASANAMTATDDLVFTVSANSSCERMTVTIRGTRTFA